MELKKKSFFVHNQHGDLFSGYILRYIERRGADLLLPVLHCRRAARRARVRRVATRTAALLAG